MITVEDLKPYLTFDDTDAQKVLLLESLISRAYAYMATSLGYNPARQTYTEKQKVSGIVDTLILRVFPVASITSIKIDGDTFGVEYVLDESAGVISLKSSVHLRVSEFEIQYEAGLDPLPSDLEGALIEYVCWMHQKIQSEGYGVKSRIVGDSTITMETGVPWTVRSVFEGYRK